MSRGGGERAARTRASRAYAGLEQREVAEALGLSVQTYKRIEAGSRPLSEQETQTLAQLCGVPVAFFDTGFDPLFDDRDALNGVLDRVLREIRELYTPADDPQNTVALRRQLRDVRERLTGLDRLLDGS